jgi:hypothetical protein
VGSRARLVRGADEGPVPLDARERTQDPEVRVERGEEAAVVEELGVVDRVATPVGEGRLDEGGDRVGATQLGTGGRCHELARRVVEGEVRHGEGSDHPDPALGAQARTSQCDDRDREREREAREHGPGRERRALGAHGHPARCVERRDGRHQHGSREYGEERERGDGGQPVERRAPEAPISLRLGTSLSRPAGATVHPPAEQRGDGEVHLHQVASLQALRAVEGDVVEQLLERGVAAEREEEPDAPERVPESPLVAREPVAPRRAGERDERDEGEEADVGAHLGEVERAEVATEERPEAAEGRRGEEQEQGLGGERAEAHVGERQIGPLGVRDEDQPGEPLRGAECERDDAGEHAAAREPPPALPDRVRCDEGDDEGRSRGVEDRLRAAGEHREPERGPGEHGPAPAPLGDEATDAEQHPREGGDALQGVEVHRLAHGRAGEREGRAGERRSGDPHARAPEQRIGADRCCGERGCCRGGERERAGEQGEEHDERVGGSGVEAREQGGATPDPGVPQRQVPRRELSPDEHPQREVLVDIVSTREQVPGPDEHPEVDDEGQHRQDDDGPGGPPPATSRQDSRCRRRRSRHHVWSTTRP